MYQRGIINIIVIIIGLVFIAVLIGIFNSPRYSNSQPVTTSNNSYNN